MVKIIEKVLKDAVNANKYKCGTREVLGSMKGSKLIMLSNSLKSESRSKLEEQAKSANVPLYVFDGNSFKLGKLCNKPFRISVLALKSGTDAEINSILSDVTKESTSSK
ncbi:MAG TPA: ribosomal L7Ae/L30e/S12e/Gadd45 family protein [Nitrososphaeraceae archaeon]|jgi:large subunit ribosomal protein L30e|nr:ribosomal L7Ae/L30e/S12e/Gadd45 family protein [Nitrososphaeraceae archaeon]